MMATQRKKLTLREQIALERARGWDLYCKFRVLQTLEKTPDKTFMEIYNTYMYTFNLWGGVEFVFWLEALAKKCRSYNSELEPIAIFPLPKRTSSDSEKILRLTVIAKQMGLDVTITKN